MVMASPPESYAMIARMATRDVLWAAWDGRGFEHLRLEIEADRVRADSLIVAGDAGGRGRRPVAAALAPRRRRGLDDAAGTHRAARGAGGRARPPRGRPRPLER